MNTREKFITIVRNAIKQQKLEPFPIDQELGKILIEQNIAQFLYPLFGKEEYKKFYLSAVSIDTNIDMEMAALRKEFNQNNIKYSHFKGYQLKRLYPPTCIRTMGDLDILIHHQDIDKVEKIFLDRGYQISAATLHDHAYRKNKFYFEMHFEMIDVSCEYYKYLSKPFDHWVLKEGTEYRFDDLYHLIYLFIHLARHLEVLGAGIRPFIDIYLYLDQYDFDYQEIQSELKKLKLDKFYDTVLSVIDYIFDFKKYPFNRLEDDKIELVIDYVSKCGIHGFGSENDAGSNSLAHRKTNLFVFYFRKMFPPYTFMKENYRYVKKCCLLLPFAYIHRLFYYIFKRKSAVKRYMSPFNKNIDKYRDIKNIIGL